MVILRIAKRRKMIDIPKSDSLPALPIWKRDPHLAVLVTSKSPSSEHLPLQSTSMIDDGGKRRSLTRRLRPRTDHRSPGPQNSAGCSVPEAFSVFVGFVPSLLSISGSACFVSLALAPLFSGGLGFLLTPSTSACFVSPLALAPLSSGRLSFLPTLVGPSSPRAALLVRTPLARSPAAPFGTA